MVTFADVGAEDARDTIVPVLDTLKTVGPEPETLYEEFSAGNMVVVAGIDDVTVEIVATVVVADEVVPGDPPPEFRMPPPPPDIVVVTDVVDVVERIVEVDVELVVVVDDDVEVVVEVVEVDVELVDEDDVEVVVVDAT